MLGVLSTIGRIAACVVAVLLCIYLIVIVLRHGSSRATQLAATSQTSLEAADYATTLTPDDPEAHYVKAIVLGNLQRVNESAVELREAIRLRPHHYYEWLDLGVTMDRLGDAGEALNAVNQSIRLAPSFAQPRWQLGNLLFRQGSYEAAFDQLRLAMHQDENLIPSTLAMAWAATGGDVAGVESLVRPDQPWVHLELARFLAAQAKGADAARHIRAAGDLQDDAERDLFNQTVASLIDSRHFGEAYEVWSVRDGSTSDAKRPGVLNADFGQAVLKDQTGFGWLLPVVPNVSVTVDPAGPPSGGRSLRLHFGGVSDATDNVVRQLVLIQPKVRYSLTFAARSESLVTGGPPAVYLLDAAHPEKIVGQSKSLPTGTTGWTSYEIQFVAGEDLTAVVLAVHRAACTEPACPIFGDLWLGAFSLREL